VEVDVSSVLHFLKKHSDFADLTVIFLQTMFISAFATLNVTSAIAAFKKIFFLFCVPFQVTELKLKLFWRKKMF